MGGGLLAMHSNLLSVLDSTPAPSGGGIGMGRFSAMPNGASNASHAHAAASGTGCTTPAPSAGGGHTPWSDPPVVAKPPAWEPEREAIESLFMTHAVASASNPPQLGFQGFSALMVQLKSDFNVPQDQARAAFLAAWPVTKPKSDFLALAAFGDAYLAMRTAGGATSHLPF